MLMILSLLTKQDKTWFFLLCVISRKSINRFSRFILQPLPVVANPCGIVNGLRIISDADDPFYVTLLI